MGITDPAHGPQHASTTASKLISANVADPLVMAFGGWSDPRSMKRYLPTNRGPGALRGGAESEAGVS